MFSEQSLKGQRRKWTLQKHAFGGSFPRTTPSPLFDAFSIYPVPILGLALSKSWFSGRGWGQQLFTFQSPAVHWIARTSSLNCLSCRNPYQTPHSLNCLPPFHWKSLFFTEKRFVASPPQKLALIKPQIFRENRAKILPGNWAFCDLIGAFSRPIGAPVWGRSGPILHTSQLQERAETRRERRLSELIGAFWAKPPFA